MNLLAHAYLSFNDPNILVGNMISDYVKGKKKFLYPEAIQQGIALHRLIDTFTDAHEATKEAAAFFRPHYRLYAGAFIDVVYDYFLANDNNEFANEEGLQSFAAGTYRSLAQNTQYMPEKFAAMFPYMQAQDWLYHYRFTYGIQKSFGGLVRRSAYLTDSETAFKVLEKNHAPLQQCYNHFFPAVKKMAADWMHNYTSGTNTI